MMNLVELQDKLKNLSQDQLVQQMQAPTGDIPQFLLLSEITRRKKMESEFEGQKAKDDTTVAEDMMAVSGMPAGFAGQMAGAVAPQTDTAMNDAVAQQQMAPAPTQGMAEGGIVALQEGGPVSHRPRLVVSGGKQFIEMPDGSLVEPGMLGFAESGMAGAGMPDLATPEPMARSDSANPSYREDRMELERPPSAPQLDFLAPRLGSPDAAPTMPSAGQRGVVPSIGQTEAIPPAMDFGSRAPLLDQFATVPPGAIGSISGAPAAPAAAFEENFGQDPASNIATIGPQPEAEMPPVQGPPVAPPARDPAQAELDALIAGTPRTQGPRPFDNLFSSIAEGGRAVIENFREPEGPLDPNLGYMMGTESPSPTPEIVVQDTQDDTTRPQPRPTEEQLAATRTPQGPGGPSGGGIASMAAAGAGAPTSYEQELLNMLESREKRAEQDKWLALAQFGLQLMSSDNPTVGGAIGEAGAPAIEALQSSRESYDQDRLGLLGTLEDYRMGQAQMALRQQAAAARSAAGAGGAPAGPSLGIDTDVNRNLTFLQNQLDAIGNAETVGQINPVDAANRRRAIEGQIAAIYGAATGLPLGMPGAGVEYGN